MKTLRRNIERLDSQLQTRRFGREVQWLDEVDSTNALAAAWAKEGTETGALIVADFQRRGRGRFDRSWEADPGTSLTFSLVIDASEIGEDLGFLPVALAVAVAETLSEYVGPHFPGIKWPNDVILAGRKIGGILTETALRTGGVSYEGHAVAGIGLNVNQDTFSGDLSEYATSIFQVTGRKTDRVTLLSDLLFSIESIYDNVLAGQTDQVIDRYQSIMIGLNDTVRFSQIDNGRTNEGTMLGVDPTGALLVRTTDGIQTIRAGEVTLRNPSQRTLPS